MAALESAVLRVAQCGPGLPPQPSRSAALRPQNEQLSVAHYGKPYYKSAQDSRLSRERYLGARGVGKRVSRLGARNGLGDFVGGDLLTFDLGKWARELESSGALGFYAPPEGGAEGRYATTLRYKGYHLMNISARGIGDPEAYLLKIHGVRPAHLGKEAIATWYLPPEIDYRLSVLPKGSKGIVLWVGEAKVLARNELQFLALLPGMRPNVKVVCEMGAARKFNWKPLKEICGLPLSQAAKGVSALPAPSPKLELSPNMVPVEAEASKVVEGRN